MKKRVEIARAVIAGYYGSGDKRIAALKKEGYDPEVVQGDVNTLLCCRENVINNIMAMAVSISNNNSWWYIYWGEKYGHECAICHPHGGENHGWQCIGLVIACWHHGGLPIPCNCGVLDNGTNERILKAKTDADALKIAQKELGIKDIKVIRNGGKLIPKEKVKPGDIMALYTGNEFQHLVLKMGSGKVADSTLGATKADDIRADRNFAGRYVSRLKMIIRYTGKGLTTPPKRTVDQLAHEVLEGLWGSGDSRKTALTQAGHDYDAVQKRVNELLGSGTPAASKPASSKAEATAKQKAILHDFVQTKTKIGQACANEKGGLGGGKAGDQTGGEVCISDYTYSKSGTFNWQHVFRAKSKPARLKIADACRKACKNNHIGYDTNSPDRKTLFKEAKKVGWEIDKITTDCETTCSELANVCVAAAGLKAYLGTDKQANVESLRMKLAASGEFKKVKLNKDTLQPGDILISGSHTAIVVGSMLRKGEESQRSKDLQEFLNYYTDGKFFKECGAADFKYGNNTYKYCCKFQEEKIGKGQGDGLVGDITIDAIKKAVK